MQSLCGLQALTMPEIAKVPVGGSFVPAGTFAIVDAADGHLVADHNWIVGRDGYVRTTVQRSCESVSVFMHYLIAGRSEGLFCDHRDRNKLNNVRTNLRMATRSQNNANRSRQKNNASGYKGVRQSGPGRFQFRLQVDKKRLFSGCYSTAEEAARAYDAAAIKHFGEFACTNFQDN